MYAITSLPNGCLLQKLGSHHRKILYCKNFSSCSLVLWSMRVSAKSNLTTASVSGFRRISLAYELLIDDGGRAMLLEVIQWVLKLVPTCPRFHLSGPWEGCRWFGGLGTEKMQLELACSRSTLSSLSSGLQDLEVKKNSMDEANEAVSFWLISVF